MDKVQKIREEVARMHDLLPVMDGDNIYLNYADRICTTLEMYIDSLQEEPVSEELEEAADNALSNVLNTHKIVNVRSCLEMFRLGAKWQKQKDNNNANHALVEQIKTQQMCYEKGIADMRQQMMAKAVDGEVTHGKSLAIPSLGWVLDKEGLNFGDKVKLIIIKQE